MSRLPRANFVLKLALLPATATLVGIIVLAQNFEPSGHARRGSGDGGGRRSPAPGARAPGRNAPGTETPARRRTRSSPPQREASDVVELRPSARELAHRRLDARGPLRRGGAVAFSGQQTFEAISPELERVRVLGFGDAIGVEQQKVARAKLRLMHRHLHRLEQADRQAANRQGLDHAAGAADQPGKVAAIAIFKLARARIVGCV